MFYIFLFGIAAIFLFLAGRDRRFWMDLTVNTDKFKSYRAKYHVLVINAQNMLERWFNNLGIVKAYYRDHPYFALKRAGFRITESYNEEMGTIMYRFWWGNEMLPQHGDITDLGCGQWSSMLDGSSRRLDLLRLRRHSEPQPLVSEWQSLFDEDVADCELTLDLQRISRSLDESIKLVEEIRQKLK